MRSPGWLVAIGWVWLLVGWALYAVGVGTGDAGWLAAAIVCSVISIVCFVISLSWQFLFWQATEWWKDRNG